MIKKLEEIEYKYRTIIEQASDALYIHDLQGRFIELNKRACDVLGYTKKELLKMNVTDVEQDFDLESAQKEWKKVKRNQILILHGRHRKKDGSIFPVEIRFGIIYLSGEKYFLGFVKDITEQKKAEEKIRSDEKRYRSTLDNMIEGCQIIGFDWRYVYINDSAEKHNKRKKEELLGNIYADMWPGIEKTSVYQFIRKCMEDRIPTQFENEFAFPDGSIGWFELSVQPVPEGVFIISYDITSRKKTELALLENEKRLRFALEGANDGIWDVKMDTGRIFLSPRGCEILGYTQDELEKIEPRWQDLVNPEDMPLTLLKNNIYFSGESKLFEVEQRLKMKNGEWKWVLTRGKFTEYDSSGKPLRMTGTHTDITGRKLAEDILRESREQYYSIFENSFDAIMLTIKNGNIISANPAACKMFQRTEDEMKKTVRSDIVDISDPRLIVLLNEREKSGSSRGELTFFRKDGSVFEGEISSSVFAGKDGIEQTSMLIRDISERKSNEIELIQNEKKYRYLFNNNPLPMWIYDLESLSFLEVNEAAVSHYGYSREEFKKMTLKDIRPVEDVTRLLKDVEDTTDTLNFAGTWRHKTKSGEIIFVEIVSHLIDYENRSARLVLSNDLTDKIRAQNELRESEEKYRTLIEIFSDAIFINQNEKVIYINKAARILFGAENDSEIIGKSLFGLFHPDYHSIIKERIKTMSKEKKGVPALEEKIVRLDGKTVDVEVSATPFILNGNPAIQVVLRDITERKQSEKALRKLSERFNLATKSAQIGIWDWDIRNNKIEWDDRMFKLYGIENRGFKGAYDTWLNGVHPDDRGPSDDVSRQALRGEIEYNTEFRVLWPDGSVHWLKANGEVYRDENGEPRRMVGINYDITESKTAEESLKISEERFRHVAECSGVWVWEVDKDGMYTYVNEMEEHILGYKPEELIEKKYFYDFFREDIKEELKKSALEIFSNKQIFRDYENPNIHKDGQIVYLETSGLPILDEQGNLTGYRGADRDVTPQKLAIEALKKSGASLKEAQHLAKIGNWEYDIISGNLVMSEEAFGIFEIDKHSPADKLFSLIMDMVHPADKQILDSQIENAIKNGAGYNYEYRILIGKDVIKNISGVGEVIINNSGIVSGLRGIIRDVTEQKKAEEKLNEALTRYKSIIRTSPQAIIVTDLSGIVNIWNEAAELIFGWNAEEVIGKQNPIIPPEKSDEVANVKNHIISGETFSGNETERVCKNGSRITVSFSAAPHRDGLGEIVGILAIVEDITERKIAENELRKQASLLELAHDSIIVHDMDLNITYWNTGASELYGWTSSEVLGQVTHTLLNTKFPVSLEHTMDILIKHGRWEGELIHSKRNGSRIIVASRWQLQKENNVPVAILEINNDITGRKKAEEEINKLNEELEQRVVERTSQLEEANKELEAFSYSVSHDLRAPLRAISGFSKILVEDYSAKLDSEGADYLNDIISNSQNMSKLIDDLLELSRYGRKQIDKSRINMKELFSNIISDVIYGSEKNINIEIADLPYAYGDLNLIKQVIINLISNAVKFSSKNPNPKIIAGFEKSEKEIMYFVKDNGVGFDMKYVHKLFGVFQRLHNVEEFNGTGVGLAIVQRIILRHNGRVWAESELGKGAVFYFSLPVG